MKGAVGGSESATHPQLGGTELCLLAPAEAQFTTSHPKFMLKCQEVRSSVSPSDRHLLGMNDGPDLVISTRNPEIIKREEREKTSRSLTSGNSVCRGGGEGAAGNGHINKHVKHRALHDHSRGRGRGCGRRRGSQRKVLGPKGVCRCQALDLQDGRAMRGVSDRSAGGSILTNDTPHGASRREPPGTSGDKG